MTAQLSQHEHENSSAYSGFMDSITITSTKQERNSFLSTFHYSLSTDFLRSIPDETNPSTMGLKCLLIVPVPARTSTNSVQAGVGMPLILSLSKDERSQMPVG